MAGLTDIIPVAKRVMIPTEDGDKPVDVRGLSTSDLSYIIARYPELMSKLGGKMTAAMIMQAGPEVIATVIGRACSDQGDKPEVRMRAEAIAATLGAGIQAEILTHVVKLTMPRGPGPFVELLKAAGLDLSHVAEASASIAQTPSDISSPEDSDTET